MLDFFSRGSKPAAVVEGTWKFCTPIVPDWMSTKDSVVACARHPIDGNVSREVRTFKTTTPDLMALSAWLSAQGCTHIVMEATGVYWKPVWRILSDGEFELALANACACEERRRAARPT